MPDVEVKLNIEAEYKQALQAIADMGAALEEVQKKAKNLTDATKNVQGDNNTDPASLEALNKASKELSENMAKVAAAGKKAQDALKAISELKPQSEESIQLLEKAAAGYEKLAEMAKNAADAAERFNKVGSAGLTTEEMLRQAQAVEKHLAALKQQSEALERNIASQKEQLNLLRQKNAEEAKAAQLNQQRERQEQLNIALLDKQAKAEEEQEYRMKLAGQTRLQLVQTIKELNAKLKEAAAAKDSEAWEKYNRQLTLANQALRKVNMSARVANIALMQQAQAAQRIGQNLDTLTKGFTGLGEAMQKGELNVVSLASAFNSMIKDLRGGVSAMGYAMLVLQGVQAMYNKVRKELNALSESEQTHKKILDANKSAYEALEKARGEYTKQQEREQTIADLNNAHKELNKTLQDGVDLINQQANAELRRLSLTQDNASFERTLRKHELGRQLQEGIISKEEYQKAMITLESEAVVGTAKNKTATSKVALTAAQNKKTQLEEQHVKLQKLSQETYDNKQKYQGFSYVELDEAEKQRAKLEEEVKEAEKKLEAFRQNKVTVDVLGGLEEVARLGLKANSWGLIDWTGAAERQQQLYLNVAGNVERAKGNLARFNKDINKRTGGVGITQYRLDKKNAEEAYTLAKNQENAIIQRRDEATQEERAKELAYRQAQEDEKRIMRQQSQLVKSQLDNMESTKKANEKRAREEQKLEQLKNIVNNLTEKALNAELELAQKDANSKNSIVSEEGKERVAYITGIFNQRANNRTRTYARFYGDGKLTKKEDAQLRGQLEQAIAEQDAEKIELYKWLLSLKNSVKKNNNEAKKTRRLLGR